MQQRARARAGIADRERKERERKKEEEGEKIGKPVAKRNCVVLVRHCPMIETASDRNRVHLLDYRNR